MKTRNKVIIGVVGACLAVATGILHEVRTCHRMRAAVERALEMNRTFQTFTSDTVLLDGDSSIINPQSLSPAGGSQGAITPHPSSAEGISLRRVVAYFDHPLRRLWTSPNDRLRAGYALGCVYRDLHEAPIAIITWEDAVAAADTTAADCDYATLYRAYGQMATLYMWQHLPEKQLKATQEFSKYALLDGDTLNYLRGLLLCNSAYYALGDTAAIFANSEAVRQQYLELGLTQEAAKVYPTPIHVAVENGQYERAREMMDEYEQHSGLFDDRGNVIDPSRAQYHYYKGVYYLGIHQIDSAEMQFRRLLTIESVKIDGIKGLMSVYKQKHNADSTYKYSRLYEAASNVFLDQTKTDAIVHTQGLYDYSRQQRIAQEQEHKANSFRFALLTFVALSVIITILVLWAFQKKKAEKQILLESYKSALEELTQAEHDTELLKQSLSKKEVTGKLIEEKEVHIQQLEKVVHKLQRQIGLSPEIIHKQNLEEAEIVKKFHSIAHSSYDSSNDLRKRIKARAATNTEWNTMMEALMVCQPRLYLFLQKHKLSDLKLKVCILSYLGFDNTEITTLTSANKGSVTNARTALAKELFNLTSAHDLNKQLHEL